MNLNQTTTTGPSAIEQLSAVHGGFATGKHDITCPFCGKNATAHVAGKTKDPARPFRYYRHVRTACRHCGGIQVTRVNL